MLAIVGAHGPYSYALLKAASMPAAGPTLRGWLQHTSTFVDLNHSL